MSKIIITNKNNTFHAVLFVVIVGFLLWLTNPSDAIKDCEKINTPEMCDVLNAE